MRSLEQVDADAFEWPDSPFGSGWSGAVDWFHLELSSLVGPRGWRSLAGPLGFVVVGISLLVYDHVNRRMTDAIFWLTLGLIVTVFARMLETNRRQRLEIEARDRETLIDRATSLDNRLKLEADIAAAVARAGDKRMLVLVELEGLQAYGDRFGYAAADELLRWTAQGLVTAVAPLAGTAYRFDESRLAVLVPASRQQLGEIVLAATESLRGEDSEVPIGRAYGEVAIPDDATAPEVALQIAAQRLAAHKQRQHRSARRQAAAVLIAALTARRPELRDHLRVVAYRSISLARRLGVGGAEIDDVALAAELQDVGQLAVPGPASRNGSPFGEAEAATVRDQALEGERMIAAAPGLAPVAKLVRSVRERYDGSGYPDGLAGDAIPLGARIIAVSGAFAALTAKPPHREALAPAEPLAKLRREAGSRFDPRVVEALAADLAEETLAATPAGAAQTSL